MSEGQAEGRSVVDQVLDVVVFLPLGAALAAQSDPSAFAERGRRHVEAQVRTARFLGELAVREATRQLQTAASDVWEGFWAARRQGTPSAADPSGSEAREPVGQERPAASGGSEAAARTSAEPPTRPAPARRAPSTSSQLAIPGYDQLSAFQVVQRLGGLNTEELEAVLAYERSHRRRKTIVSRVEQLLSGRSGGGGGSGKR